MALPKDPVLSEAVDGGRSRSLHRFEEKRLHPIDKRRKLRAKIQLPASSDDLSSAETKPNFFMRHDEETARLTEPIYRLEARIDIAEIEIEIEIEQIIGIRHAE